MLESIFFDGFPITADASAYLRTLKCGRLSPCGWPQKKRLVSKKRGHLHGFGLGLKISKGTVLFRQGDPPGNCYVRLGLDLAVAGDSDLSERSPGGSCGHCQSRLGSALLSLLHLYLRGFPVGRLKPRSSLFSLKHLVSGAECVSDSLVHCG